MFPVDGPVHKVYLLALFISRWSLNFHFSEHFQGFFIYFGLIAKVLITPEIENINREKQKCKCMTHVLH